MQIKLTKTETKSDLLILPLFSKEQPSKARNIPVSAFSDFKNKIGTTHLIYTPETRILLVGLGEKKQFSSSAWRTALHAAINQALGLGVGTINLILPSLPSSQLESFFELTGFGITFSLYRFDEYKKEKNGSKLTQINLTGPASPKLTKSLNNGIVIGTAANTARSLGNHPGNIATPAHLAAHAQELSKKYGFSCKILTSSEIDKEKMGLLQGVAAGSDQEAKFIVVEHGPKSKPPIVLIGKGLTFDSGGISIKPADRMEEMKFDMCGGATVLGIFEAASKLKLSVHLVGIIPAAENLVSGKAVKPGDILIGHDGTSVEIINTDAEGRLVLADAISYSKKYYKPKLIVDYATLTGAVLIALGDEYTGYFSNTDVYLKEFKKSSAYTAEKIWHLPLAPEYKDQLKSAVADIKNIGDRGSAGSSTAALFLEHFVGNTPWIHLDIAGTAWTVRPKSYAALGATGWGVFLTINFLRTLR